MWFYKKPGFESHLLAELQRQQQCSQFCDTLLKTEGVSVPAHSCVLSAISSHISSALSSSPPPPAGQGHLLEFRALSACTLLHMVRLLYSGEMAGEGEEEKQEAISAAAKLGIHGLVEVTRRDHNSREEVGVQSEPLMPEENEGRWGRWRRETLSNGGKDGKDTWTQTDELQVNSAPPSYPAPTFETIDMTALQSLGQTNPHLLPSDIPCVPISLVYPVDDTHQPSFAPVNCMQDSTAAGHTPVAVVALPHTAATSSFLASSSQATSCAVDPQSWYSQRAASDAAGEEEPVEQFQGNIPGYINYFLNQDIGEDSCKETTKRRREARVRGARKAGTGERRARRPRASTGGGRAREGLKQEVRVSKLSKLFLQRGGMRASRTGQGGGAAGRKLYLKTRDLLKSTKSCQRRRAYLTELEFSPGGDMQPVNQGGAANSTRHGQKSKMQQFNQDNLPVPERAQRTRAKPATSVSISSHPMQSYNIHTSSGPAPPPAPPPQQEQPEQLDLLLEELFMGYNILPIIDSGAPHSQPPPPTNSGSCATLAQDKQGCSTGRLEADVGFQGSTNVVAVARGAGGSISANSEVPVLQQQQQQQQEEEGELTDILEHFLQSFERHVDSCAAREEVERGGQSCTGAPGRSCYSKAKRKTTHSKPDKDAPATHPKVSHRKAKAPATQKRTKTNKLSLEKTSVSVKQASSNNSKTRVAHDRGDQQLQQMPVVKLERTNLLPAQITLLGHSCQSLEVKNSASVSSSSVKCPHGSRSGKTVWTSTKIYPIRSRLKKENLDSSFVLMESLGDNLSCAHSQPGHSKYRGYKNGRLLSLPNAESPPPLIQVPPEEEHLTNDQGSHEEVLMVRQQEEAEVPTRKGKKRGTERNEETSDDATVAKRSSLEQMPQPTSECADFETTTSETEDIIDVDTVSLTSVGGCLVEPVCSEIKLRETEECLRDEEMGSSSDEIINVDEDVEDDCESRTAPSLSQFIEVKPSASPPSHSEVGLGSAGSWEDPSDEDIDVIGGSSPVPDPVIINWTESSEDDREDGGEEIDVVGEKRDYKSSMVFTMVSQGELVNREYQTEHLSCPV